MLKLVPAKEVPFDSVIEYCESFGNCRDYECEVLEYADISESAYKGALRDMKKNKGYLFYLIDDECPEYLIGLGNIANITANYHSPIFDTGCLSGGIRPDERNKGYASEILPLLLKECKSLGLKEVCISCYKDNKASIKIIENNHGVLERNFFRDGCEALKYWIPTIKEKDKIKCKTLNYVGRKKSN